MRLIAPLAAAMVASMAGQEPAFAGPPTWTPPTPKDVAGVKVVNAATSDARKLSAGVAKPPRTSWPAAATSTVELTGSGAAPSGAPIRVRPAAGADDSSRSLHASDPAPSKVAVTVLDRAATDRAHVQGLLFGVARADGGTRPTSATVQIDYSGFADAYGGDWASRLRLVQLPKCVLTTPDQPQCQGATPLNSVNDTKTATLTAVTPMAATGTTVLATEAPADGDNGDYKATSLTQAGTWQVSQQTGDFAWSYDVRVPGILGAQSPNVSLAYSSGSVDGRTGGSNNQASWIGDGWDSWPGFIERKYASCTDDNPGHKTGDQCWFNDNATLSLNGHAGELIQSGSVWRLKNDDGTKIEKVTGDGNRANGDNDNEYWKVTTTDGTQYFFGYHRLPGWTSGKPVTDSTWTEPVYGNNTGEPCYNATFANARCDQAWRWNLDYVVDPHNFTSAYFYGKETGAYARDLQVSQRTTYVRGGWLDHIDYGMRAGAEYTVSAPAKIVFTTSERCDSACWSGAAWTSTPTTANWKDTPWDLDCPTSPCATTELSPTFWSARRLNKITTQLRNGTSSYADVESWTLRQEFPNAGNNEGSPLWLAGITRTGLVTTAGGTAVSDPEITFDHGADSLPNRVDGPADNRTALNRWRVKAINTESGGQIIVSYSPVSDCVRTSLPNPETNTTRCMPAFYANPNTGNPTLDWFHKYVVTRIDLDDLVTDQPNQTTTYDYLDTPAWHYTDDEITPAKYKTWGQWRGYGRVQVRQGDPAGQQSAVEYRYLRGMDGDHLSTGTRGVSVADSWGGSRADHEALQGFLLQEITLNGPGGAEVKSTVNEPWKTGPTATRTAAGVTTNAWKTNLGSTRTRIAVAGGFRTSKVTNSYNTDGLITGVEESGDENVTGDESCRRTSYARNDTAWMIDKVSQEELTSGTCATAVTAATVLKRTRIFYDTYADDSSFGLPPTAGNVVRREELDHWTGSTPNYVATESSKYDTTDTNSRVTEVKDANGNATTTAYTTANGGLITQTVETNVLGHQVTTTKEPAWDLATHIVDPNGVVTDLAYDGLGRLTSVWLPGRAKATQTPTQRYTYNKRNIGGPTAVTSESLLPSGSAYKKSISLYDGLLRLRQNQTQTTGGGRLITDTKYTTAGQTDWTSQPYYDITNTAPGESLGIPQGQIPSITVHTYDGANRETGLAFKALGVEQWHTTTGYGGDRINTTPPAGDTATTKINDVLGNVTELRQYKNPADVGSNDPAKFDKTTYTYDLRSQLKTVTDPAGNTWSNSYDLRGRQTQSIDPDKGTNTTTYTATGQVETLTGQVGSGTATVAYTYDPLDRKTSLRDDSTTGALRATWTYDTLTNGKGKQSSATRYVGGNAYTTRTDAFDVYGRATSTSVVLPASESSRLCAAAAPNPCTYTTTQTFKTNGQLYQNALPAAGDLPSEKLTLGYDDIGEQTTVISPSQIYLYAVTYDKLGQLTQRQLGAYGSRIAVTSTYDEPTRRLRNTNVVPELKAEAANYTYTYDNAGNITAIGDTPAGQTADNQCFTYDYLRRLTEAWTPASGNCLTAPTTAGLGGPSPYWQSWTINAVGNRTQQVQHATAGDTTTTYTYPAAGGARPHAVGTVTASGASTWTHNYTYDNGGNTKTRTTSSGAAQTLTYDREGLLTTLVEGTTTNQYIYDADGNRLISIDATGRTLYFGTTEVRYTNSTTAKTGTRYYTHNGDTIAIRTATALNWIIDDHHGSPTMTVDAATLNAAKKRMLPYGETRGALGASWPGGLTRGFAGGVEDPTGLTHLGAREYDPAIGHFISVDSKVDPLDPQTLNGYIYSSNNPSTLSDPNGEKWGWIAAIAVVVVVVAVVAVAIACPAVIPALVAAGSAAIEAGVGAAAAGATASGVAVAAGGAAGAELPISGGTAMAAGAVATGLVAAGAIGRLWFRGGDEPIGAPAPKVRATGPDLLKPGPWAKRSLPATSTGYTEDERNQLTVYMHEDGCHSCGATESGTPLGKAVPDHQDATSTLPPGQRQTKEDEPGSKQRLYPHCWRCSNEQGLYLLKNPQLRWPKNQGDTGTRGNSRGADL